ncbi:MAG: NAD(P)-dependent dehydrogenase, short-chain alcohol dehydrogenase family [Chloroflexi bacterium AL-W]|nr:NAD(P)-dependent dehydrogenase, short-chain alcohol dehydrogenase family [Chloroflexi bacterium AL-W]
MADFAGKVALVMGGTLGIGYESAKELLQQGAKVVIGGRNRANGEKALSELKAYGDVTYIVCDVTSLPEVEAIVKQTLALHGKIDYLVNSAGLEGVVANTVDCTEENFQAVVNTNLMGTWYLMKTVIPHMLDNGGGAIVNVSSVIGVIAFPGLPAYTASKAAMIGLSKTTALEYAKQNIRVNVVCPGSIRTPMYNRFSGGTPEAEAYMSTFHPIGRIGEPPEVSSAVLWLLSDGSSFVTGHVLPVAGGWEVP